MIDQYDILIEDLPPDYRQIAEAIGLEAALALAEIRDGEGVYVPKRERIYRAARDRTIRSEFDGSNYKQLARRHGLTEVWIRAIVHRRNETPATGVDTIDKQIPLFQPM